MAFKIQLKLQLQTQREQLRVTKWGNVVSVSEIAQTTLISGQCFEMW